MSRLRPLGLALLLGTACAKGEERESGFVETTDAGAPARGPGVFVDAAEPEPPNVECAEETRQIFVLGSDKALYRFDPPKLAFTRIGTIGCATAAGTFSMAIDRRGTAWVEFMDGNLFAVDTRTASCKPTAFKPGQTGFANFGMGFSLNGDEFNNETLWVSGAGLASLDTKTFELGFKGSLALGRTELTGLGTQLFAFGVESGLVVELDKITGATKKSYRTSAVQDRSAFAFAQWGGDFWLFTGEKMSSVTRYSPITDVSTVVVENAGVLIVGAGSSTCAPVKPPS